MFANTIIEDRRWAEADLPALTDRAARATLGHLGLSATRRDICVMGCDDARIAVLNADFRGRAGPTNVLSWPAADLAAGAEGGPPRPPARDELGDIALAWETCRREADTAGRPFEAHVTHLVVHGVLHLLGYDHERDGDAVLMERHERDILATLGLPDPYAGGADGDASLVEGMAGRLSRSEKDR